MSCNPTPFITISKVALTVADEIGCPLRSAQYVSVMPIEVQLPSLQKGIGSEQRVSLKTTGVEGQTAALPLHLVTFILNKFESAPAQYGEERIEQIVSVELKAFAGHEAEEPVHFSVISQTSVEALQIVEEELKAFAGHEAEEPVHFSVISQGPVESLHTVKVELRASVGQAPPLHTSLISHGPAEARQV
ncbi:MAG: hypothetical protein PHY59_09580 [Methanobacterium sp.]|nr:hypothetical protein [Methanobacterium sp.]